MARVNVDLLGISKLKWTGRGEFNSDDKYIYYCGQESLRRNGVDILVNKSLKCSTWMQSWMNRDRMISVRFQGKAFNIMVIQVCAPTSNPEEAEVGLHRTVQQDLLELTPSKDVLFIIGDWNEKVGIQEISGVTSKFVLEYKMKQGKD